MTAAHVRFLQNNQAAASGSTVTVSSAVAGFPGTNSVLSQRWRKWRPAGAFIVVASNKTIYISDGSNKTVTLTEATYATGTLLAAHIQTQLNASSSGWTCTYSTTTYKFTIGRATTTRSLRLTQTTDAAWSMLGYVGASDFDPGTGTAADVRRNHTAETWHVDFGVATEVSAFVAIAPGGMDFPLSSSATAVLMASNTNNFTTPDLTITLTPTAYGIVSFFTPVTYRYWTYKFIDLTNTAGPNLDHSVIYLGDYVEPLTRNLNLGFQRRQIDPSIRTLSEGGSLYFRQKTRYWIYSANEIEWVADADREELERLVAELGTTVPFFVSVDPDGVISDGVEEFTKYMIFDDEPAFQHQRYKYYKTVMTMREVI